MTIDPKQSELGRIVEAEISIYFNQGELPFNITLKEEDKKPFSISYHASSRAKRHSMNVYPCEAFGLLIGSLKDNFIDAALPLSKTEHWYVPAERFHNIEQGIIQGKEFVKNTVLDVIGVYHSYSGGHPDIKGSERFILKDIPQGLRNYLMLVVNIEGNETIWQHPLYHWDKGWQELKYKKTPPRSIWPEFTSKRIHSRWIKAHGAIDYSNNHVSELRRLYGEDY